jgi:hypothetical protein
LSESASEGADCQLSEGFRTELFLKVKGVQAAKVICLKCGLKFEDCHSVKRFGSDLFFAGLANVHRLPRRFACGLDFELLELQAV